MPHPSLLLHRRAAFISLALCFTALFASAAENVPEPERDRGSKLDELTRAPAIALASFLDSLPDLVDQGVPSFAPQGAFRLYLRPRFGDLLHEDYFRFLVGARQKVNEQLEINAELGTYFTHGLRESVGNGLYQFRVGSRYEFAYNPESGWNVGLDWITPLSRPPYEITDGLRHTMPFVTYTRTISPKHGLVGFTTLGFDFQDGTSLPVNYAENQLHANSTMLTLGVARQWRRMHVILRVFDANTVLLSNHSENVIGLRPSLGIPFLRRPNGVPRFTATFEGRAIWGPDGFETGVNTSIRLDLEYRRGAKSK
ncbi:MAG: hypothetical protein ABIZ04_11405 [Opitutus sp.]